MQPHCFPTERVKISYILSLLTGLELQREETIWQQAEPIIQFLKALWHNFMSLHLKSKEIKQRVYVIAVLSKDRALCSGFSPNTEYSPILIWNSNI